MGCDIHAYLDYDEFPTDDGWYVSCFAEDLDLGRNYALFSLMAGVRRDPDREQRPLFEPKGMPDRYSYQVKRAYSLSVYDDLSGVDRNCSIEQAEKWIKRGISIWLDDKHISDPDWHSASWLTASELEQVKAEYEQIGFYESSWTQMRSPEEQPVPENSTVKKRATRYGEEWLVQVGEKKTYPAPITLDATIVAMHALNGDNPHRSRLVFWFDN